MPAAMPCKTPTICRGETCRNIGKDKTKNACIVDADESTRIRLEGVPHRYHEDHISAKGINLLSRCNLVHKFILMPQALKIPDAKAAAVDKSQKQKRDDRRSKEKGQKSSFCVIDGSLSSQKFGVRASISKLQRQSRAPR